MRKPLTFTVDGRQMTAREIRESPYNIHGINDGQLRGRLKSGDDSLARLLRPLDDFVPAPTREQPSTSPTREVSDGSTASYYELPDGARKLQDLISYKDMNGQIAEIFRTGYRYGEASHSDRLRDAKKIRFYANAEIERLEKLV